MVKQVLKYLSVLTAWEQRLKLVLTMFVKLQYLSPVRMTLLAVRRRSMVLLSLRCLTRYVCNFVLLKPYVIALTHLKNICKHDADKYSICPVRIIEHWKKCTSILCRIYGVTIKDRKHYVDIWNDLNKLNFTASTARHRTVTRMTDLSCYGVTTSNSSSRCHVTPLLRDRHWLPIKQRVQYKLCMLSTAVCTQRHHLISPISSFRPPLQATEPVWGRHSRCPSLCHVLTRHSATAHSPSLRLEPGTTSHRT